MVRLITIILFILTTVGCKTYSYFNGGNDFLKKDVQIFLIDGTEVNGKLSVQFTTGHDHDKYLNLLTTNNVEKKILITDIKYYKYNNDFYYPKELNLESYEIPYRDKLYTPTVNNILFLKRITDQNSKLEFFELYQSKTNTLDGIDKYDYYISFKDENRFIAWSTRGNKFFPNFEDKMSILVSDCPSLSEKIKQKTNGYSVKQISLDIKKNEVIKRIVDEYNRCN